MAFPSLEEASNKVSNRYLLVVLAAKRARQLNRGAAAQVDSRHKKPTSVALKRSPRPRSVPREGRRRNPKA